MSHIPCVLPTGSQQTALQVYWNPTVQVIKSVPLPHIHTGSKRVPRVRAAMAIQAIRVAITPIANMLARAHSLFL